MDCFVFCLPYSDVFFSVLLPIFFNFLFAFFRHFPKIISRILSFLLFSPPDNALYLSGALFFFFFAIFLCSFHNGIYLFLHTFFCFLRIFCCLVIISGVLFDITLINNFLSNHCCLPFSLKSTLFILFAASILVLYQK